MCHLTGKSRYCCSLQHSCKTENKPSKLLKRSLKQTRDADEKQKGSSVKNKVTPGVHKIIKTGKYHQDHLVQSSTWHHHAPVSHLPFLNCRGSFKIKDEQEGIERLQLQLIVVGMYSSQAFFASAEVRCYLFLSSTVFVMPHEMAFFKVTLQKKHLAWLLAVTLLSVTDADSAPLKRIYTPGQVLPRWG